MSSGQFLSAEQRSLTLESVGLIPNVFLITPLERCLLKPIALPDRRRVPKLASLQRFSRASAYVWEEVRALTFVGHQQGVILEQHPWEQWGLVLAIRDSFKALALAEKNRVMCI